MEKSFSECGLYAQRLADLAKRVKEENANVLTEKNIVANIILAYQESLRIISTYPEVDVANILSITVGYMEKNPQMIATGTINPKELALVAVTDAIKENTNELDGSYT